MNKKASAYYEQFEALYQALVDCGEALVEALPIIAKRLLLLWTALVVVALLLVLASTQCTTVVRSQGIKLLLVNGGMEGGWHRATAYWTPGGGPFHNQYQEITPPEGWTAYWREGFPCSGTSDWVTGRPEVRIITAVPDPERIYSGTQAAQFFTFWRCHDGGLLQQVAVEQGHYYTLSAFAHAWYSHCSLKPHNPPLEADCVTPIDWAHDWLSVGIDPTGGIDPTASTVVWGQTEEIYGIYADPLTVESVQVQGPIATVFLRSEATIPLKHNDVHWDEVTLRDVTYRVFLPII